MTTQTEIGDAARKLLTRGAREVVITLGERGALWVTYTQNQFVPAFRVQAVDTTAAGDAFNAGLAVALARGAEMTLALRYASAVAALSVTRFGAQSSLPSRVEVEHFLAMSS